jgi:lipid-A-disaccharide synthase
MKTKKIFFLAGEQSGDLHGALVIKQMKKLEPQLQVFGVGGAMMEAAGMKAVYSSDDLAVIGFVEVVKNVTRLLKIERGITRWLKKEKPEMVVLIDYPGFNKRIAKIAKNLGIHVVYYICPQVWAWQSGRVKEFSEIVSEAIVVFPFEVDIWRKTIGQVNYFGHPLIGIAQSDKDKGAFLAEQKVDDGPLVALLPGSRKQEIDFILPELLKTAQIIHDKKPNTRFILPIATALENSLVERYTSNYTFPIKILKGETYNAINAAELCIVASGTATLETAIIGTPMIVVYKVNWLTSFLSRYLIEAEHIGLPNVIAGKRIIPEFIRGDFDARLIAKEALDILQDVQRQEAIRAELALVKEKLGSERASTRVAEYLCQRIREINHACN